MMGNTNKTVQTPTVEKVSESFSSSTEETVQMLIEAMEGMNEGQRIEFMATIHDYSEKTISDLATGRCMELFPKKVDIPIGEACVICLDAEKIMCFVPCGHICMCEECSKNDIETCPICRGDVIMVIKTFN